MKRIFSFVMALALLGSALPVLAATSAYPTGPSSVTVGQTFNVVFVLGSAQDVDTIRLNGSYTQDLLEYRGASPSGVFQNVSPGTYNDSSKGIFSFGAFTLSSKANGAARVAVLTFKALKEGSAYVQLTTGSRVLSAGEDQLGSVGRLNIAIKPAPTPQPSKPGEAPPGEPVLTITSPTHVKSDAWYPSADVKIDWKIEGKSTSRVYVGFDQEPDGAAETPTTATSAQFTATNDGVWYFHLYVRYSDGSTGRADFPVQIDRTNPGPVVPVTDQTDVLPTIPNSLRYSALDGTSGVAFYEIYFNGSLVTSTAFSSYPLSGLAPGTYEVAVKAYDRAGNSSSGTTTFRILEKVSELVPIAAQWPLKTIVAIGAFIVLVLFLLSFLPYRRRKREEEDRRRSRKKSTKE